MTDSFRLVMGQINPVVGDVSGNVKKIIDAAQQARDALNADLVVFSELTITGYPPEDLLHRPGLMKRVELGLEKLKRDLQGVAVLIGHPAGRVREDLYNAASVIADGECLITYYKQYLPNYSVFDEERYFVKGHIPGVFEHKGIKFGISICEDIWFTGPATQAADHGAEIILNLNASPYRQGKCQLRELEVAQRVTETGLPIVYVNQVGGQDELVFDGGSFAFSGQGQKVVRAPAWQEGLYPIDIIRGQDGQLQLSGEVTAKESDLEMIYRGLVLGLRDYIEKNHFPGVVSINLDQASAVLKQVKVRMLILPLLQHHLIMVRLLNLEKFQI